jgi:hypothetical protein
LGQRFQPKGYAFLAFLFGEILALGIVISLFSDTLAKVAKNNPALMATMNLSALILVGIEVYFRLYA